MGQWLCMGFAICMAARFASHSGDLGLFFFLHEACQLGAKQLVTAAGENCLICSQEGLVDWRASRGLSSTIAVACLRYLPVPRWPT